MANQTSEQDIGKIPIKGSEKKPEKFQDMTVVVKPRKPVCMQVHAAEETNKLNEKSLEPKLLVHDWKRWKSLVDTIALQ